MSKFGKAFTDTYFGKSHLEVGNIVKHYDGRQVKIISGQYFGEYGISNFWQWQEVLPDGTLGKIESGYGW